MTDQIDTAKPLLPTEPGKNRRPFLLILGLTLVPLLLVVGYALLKGSGGTSKSSYKDIDWVILKELDLNTGVPSQRLHELDGKKVRAPGFMVPLEDNRSEVTEYLLVPNPQACIHAPPPPSNQMVYVRMVEGPAKMIYGPVWVEGTLRVSSHTHQYGNAGFQIYGEVTVPYK
ncbi:MAG: DUF3299 domain-containing protein [Proteobacteria bacterium]|nr:DUF3299 domain-containing protein [Pseudomonadota bacterium]